MSNETLEESFYTWREKIVTDWLQPVTDWSTGLLSWSEYQGFTTQGAFYPGANTGNKDELSYLMISLGGEVGETLDAFKKILRDVPVSNPLVWEEAINSRAPKLLDELGDVFWYLAQMLSALGLPLEAILIYNTIKLCERHNQPWPYENLPYKDALNWMRHIESQITNLSASTSMDTDTS